MEGTTNGVRATISTVEEIKAFRVDVDALIQRASILSIDTTNGSTMLGGVSTHNVYIHLIEAKMWLGKCLEAMGNPFPAELADKSTSDTTASNDTNTSNSTGEGQTVEVDQAAA